MYQDKGPALKAVSVPEADGVLDAVRPALIAPGEYDLRYLYHETGMLFAGKAPKLSLWFKVVTLGPFLDAKVARYYNVKQLLSKPGKGGRFAFGWHSELMSDYARLFGEPRRPDRLSLAGLKGVVVRGAIRTVRTNWKQKARPECLTYSVIDSLIRVMA
jgi:hypothetical protein